ncbi:K(+)/H(+) antiporter [Marasmius crinis-equi]|uniref:K(+)/H(+) antiporter n=1 Tax=Marasmius crinis-equi TaxID=585013 RepID=A0ABR3FND1_9AGAR
MGQFSQDVALLRDLLMKRAATEQGGVLSGDNPARYNDSDPIRLWVIQLVIIVCFTQILALILGRIRQPRVIAEVIGGIVLGPSVMGRIPHFRDTIFPNQSMPLLNLTANIGLVLFLFLVGMEIDTRLLKRNFKASACISVAGLIVPLGLGAALGVGVYHEFVNPSVNFGYFLLFVAVAVGITAFPVLCRILTETKLLDTTVGVVTLSAGIGNDVVGWILLALTVSLVNASNGLTALYVLLCSVGFVIFLLFPVRWAYHWMARKTGSLEQGTPTTFMMTTTLLLVFIAAFFTDIIGVHAIFGGFLAGLIIPKENGFTISLVEKIEDLVSILLLPLYFTLSGLRTNLGLLDNGVTWGYVILICLVAFASKFFSCGLVAKAFGFNWRESGAIGSLMSCKGLVELIVLNVGFQANILDDRTFSMFVVHAIILTFVTTPLTLAFYPEHLRDHHGSAAKPVGHDSEQGQENRNAVQDVATKTRFALVLDKLEQLPAAMTLTQLLHPFGNVLSQSTTSPDSASVSESDLKQEKQDSGELPGLSKEKESQKPAPSSSFIDFTLLRLIELSGRTSALFKSTEAAALVHTDPVTSVFNTFAWLAGLGTRATSNGKASTLNTALEVVAWDDFTGVVKKQVEQRNIEMVLVPWASTGSGAAAAALGNQEGAAARNPFDGVFHRSGAAPTSPSAASSSQHDQMSSVVYAEFIRKVFLTTPCDVALFVDRGSGRLSVDSAASPVPAIQSVLFLPFFGGPDDRSALNFLLQICSRNSGVKAVVVRIQRDEDIDSGDESDIEKEKISHLAHNTVSGADTVYGRHSTQTRLASDTADNILWENSSTAGLPRVTFSTRKTSRPLQEVVDLVSSVPSAQGFPELSGAMKAGGNVIVVCGRSRQMTVESLSGELSQIASGTGGGGALASSVSRTLGDVGAAMVAVGARASLLVVQARVNGSHA